LSAIGLSGDVGLVALFLLTTNLLLGLLISVRYSPWRYWPHKRINIFRLHNQTGFAALAACMLHPILLLFSRRAGFDWLDIVFPAWAPRQPTINLLGAIGLYTLGFVLITSHYRVQLGRRRWKTLHFSTYLLAGVVFLHSLLTDPHLNGTPFQPLDGEKLFVEGCILIVLSAVWLRIRHARRRSRRAPSTDSAEQIEPLAEETTPEGTL
jgi:DMSO/TMAO reductase YedYZ heme-binding membrane subunit